jgi:hypothetical protein
LPFFLNSIILIPHPLQILYLSILYKTSQISPSAVRKKNCDPFLINSFYSSSLYCNC